MDHEGLAAGGPARARGVEQQDAPDPGVLRGLHVERAVPDIEALRRIERVFLHQIEDRVGLGLAGETAQRGQHLGEIRREPVLLQDRPAGRAAVGIEKMPVPGPDERLKRLGRVRHRADRVDAAVVERLKARLERGGVHSELIGGLPEQITDRAADHEIMDLPGAVVQPEGGADLLRVGDDRGVGIDERPVHIPDESVS